MERRRRGNAGLELAITGALLLGAGLIAAPGPVALAQEQHRDAAPRGIPPGFHPVDVSEEVRAIDQREAHQIDLEAAVDMQYRYATPERRLRARYGSATWDLYEPYD